LVSIIFFPRVWARSEHVLRVCLDRAKNNVRIKELRIVSEDSEKIVIFQLARG
jgi:hypothetical protein